MFTGQFVSATASQQECGKLVVCVGVCVVLSTACVCTCVSGFFSVNVCVCERVRIYASLCVSPELKLGSCEELRIIAIS